VSFVIWHTMVFFCLVQNPLMPLIHSMSYDKSLQGKCISVYRINKIIRNQRKNINYFTVRRISKSNIKIVERGIIDTFFIIALFAGLHYMRLCSQGYTACDLFAGLHYMRRCSQSYITCEGWNFTHMWKTLTWSYHYIKVIKIIILRNLKQTYQWSFM
jgi:hypothetical protein